jgi:DNA (cytosine-5)-methyltransferase 1
VLTVGGLFSGIGGWELGLERAGMRVLWHCEADPFCQRVLEHHWPHAPVYPDVCELRGTDVEPVDVLCGGFPCQDISHAGTGAGIDGERSGLWSEMFRLTAELQPRYLLVENVAALLVRGFDRVLTDLATLGFDAEWDCLRASDFGAPHQRDRIWLVAYPQRGGRHGLHERRESRHMAPHAGGRRPDGARWTAASDHGGRVPGQGPQGSDDHLGGPWPPEPDVGRVAHGIPERLDRNRALGNALIPQIAEWIGRRIIDYEEEGRLAA